MLSNSIINRLYDWKALFLYNPANVKPDYSRTHRNFYFIRNHEPYIVTTLESIEDLNILSDCIGPKKEAVIIKLLVWSNESLASIRRIRYFYELHKAKYPNHLVHILCNTEKEFSLISQITNNASYINQNAFLDERLFSAENQDPKMFDVIYNGRLVGLKRQHLLSGLDNRTALLSDTITTKDYQYLNYLKRKIPRATILKFSPPILMKDFDFNVEIPQVAYEEICKYLRMAKTGVILSREEGACYASTEYLLSGLPVVSTHSRGGREVFFDNRYCRLTPGNSSKIKKAVDELIALNPDPQFIRNETIKKMSPHRERFKELLFEINRKFHIETNKASYWESIYSNKLMTFSNEFPSSFISQLQ
jgi:glycosyltransferase involved in cell wall biosynthesis